MLGKIRELTERTSLLEIRILLFKIQKYQLKMPAELNEGGVGATLRKIRQLTFLPKYAQNPKYKIGLVELRARVKGYDLAWHDVPNTGLDDLAYMLQMDGGFVRELKSMAVEDEKRCLKKQPFTCELCKQKFAYKQAMERHTYSSHESTAGFKMKEVKAFVVKEEKKDKDLVDLLREEMDMLKAQEIGEEGGKDQEYDDVYEEKRLSSFPPEGSQQTNLDVPKCSICGHQPMSAEELNKHMKAKHLKEHLKHRKEQLNYLKEQCKCSICGHQLMSTEELNKHMKAKHVEEEHFPCSSCDYVTSSGKELELHKGEVHRENQLRKRVQEIFPVGCQNKCGQCGKQVASTYEKGEHIILDHPWPDLLPSEDHSMEARSSENTSKSLGQKKQRPEGRPGQRGKMLDQAPLEDKMLAAKEAFKRALNGGNEKEKEVTEARKEVVEKKTDEEAKKRKGDQGEGEVCNPPKQCKTGMDSVAPGKGFQPSIALACKLCRFTTIATTMRQGKIDLERHIEKQHGENRIEACGYCDETFPLRADNLKRHYKRQHPTQVSLQRKLEIEGQFKCNQCDLSYIRQAGLKHHVQRKHGPPVDRPVVQQQSLVKKKIDCPHCGYSSDRGSHVKRHLGAVHPDSAIQRVAIEGGNEEGAFKCGQCDISCVDKDALKTHVNLKHHPRDGKVKIKQRGVRCHHPHCETVSDDQLSGQLHYQQDHPEAREKRLEALRDAMLQVIQTQDLTSLPPLGEVLKANVVLRQLGSEISESKYLCFKCTRTSEFSNALRSGSQVEEHLLRDHWHMMGRQCGFCKKTEKDEKALFRHMFLCPTARNQIDFRDCLTG